MLVKQCGLVGFVTPGFCSWLCRYLATILSLYSTLRKGTPFLVGPAPCLSFPTWDK